MSERWYDKLKTKAGDVFYGLTSLFLGRLKSEEAVLTVLRDLGKAEGLQDKEIGKYMQCTLPSKLDQRKFPEKCKSVFRPYGAKFSSGLDVELVSLWSKNFTWGDLAHLIFRHLNP